MIFSYDSKTDDIRLEIDGDVLLTWGEWSKFRDFVTFLQACDDYWCKTCSDSFEIAEGGE